MHPSEFTGECGAVGIQVFGKGRPCEWQPDGVAVLLLAEVGEISPDLISQRLARGYFDLIHELDVFCAYLLDHVAGEALVKSADSVAAMQHAVKRHEHKRARLLCLEGDLGVALGPAREGFAHELTGSEGCKQRAVAVYVLVRHLDRSVDDDADVGYVLVGEIDDLATLEASFMHVKAACHGLQLFRGDALEKWYVCYLRLCVHPVPSYKSVALATV